MDCSAAGTAPSQLGDPIDEVRRQTPLLALDMELVVGFALLQPPPDEPPAALRYSLGTTDSIAAAGDRQPGCCGLADRYAFRPM